MVAVVDPEEFYDFQVNRPTVSTTDEGMRRITLALDAGVRRPAARLAPRRGAAARHRAEHEVAPVLRRAARLRRRAGRRAGGHPRRDAGRDAAHPADPGQRHRHRARPRGPAQAGAGHLRGPDRDRRRVPGRLRRGSTSPPSRSGPRSPTTCRSRRARRPRWRCSARSRTCSRPASRWATCPRTAAPGSAASPSSPRRTRTSPSTSATSRRARTPPSSPRPAVRRSPGSSSATSSGGTRRRSRGRAVSQPAVNGSTKFRTIARSA